MINDIFYMHISSDLCKKNLRKRGFLQKFIELHEEGEH